LDRLGDYTDIQMSGPHKVLNVIFRFHNTGRLIENFEFCPPRCYFAPLMVTSYHSHMNIYMSREQESRDAVRRSEVGKTLIKHPPPFFQDSTDKCDMCIDNIGRIIICSLCHHAFGCQMNVKYVVYRVPATGTRSPWIAYRQLLIG